MSELPVVELWTDGSGTTQAPGGWAFILRFDGPNGLVERVGIGGAVETTSQRMEVTAFLRGLEAIKRPCEIHFTSDSQYVAHAIRFDWIANWERKRWHGVKNSDLWTQIWKYRQIHRIKATWVKGHAGTELNERCDVLAGECRRAILDAVAAGSLDAVEFDVEGTLVPPVSQLAL